MQAARGASLNSSDSTNTEPTGRSRRRHLLLFAAIAATTYALDVVTKVLAVEYLRGEPRIPLVGDVLSLYLTYNSGAAFSFLTGHTELLTVVAVAATVVVLWVARRLGSTGWAIALGFLLGGVLGNLTDRLLREPGFMGSRRRWSASIASRTSAGRLRQPRMSVGTGVASPRPVTTSGTTLCRRPTPQMSVR